VSGYQRLWEHPNDCPKCGLFPKGHSTENCPGFLREQLAAAEAERDRLLPLAERPSADPEVAEQEAVDATHEGGRHAREGAPWLSPAMAERRHLFAVEGPCREYDVALFCIDHSDQVTPFAKEWLDELHDQLEPGDKVSVSIAFEEHGADVTCCICDPDGAKEPRDG